MNIKALRFDASMIVWLRLAGYCAAAAAVLALYYHFTVANSKIKLRELSSRVITVQAKYERYDKFATFQNTLDEAKEATDALLGVYIDILSSAQKSQNVYLDQISAMSVQSKVKLDKIAPAEADGKKYYNISFTGDYASTCEFFSLLEKYFRVETLAVEGGGESSQHKTSIKVTLATDAIANVKMNPVTGKDIFDLYTEDVEVVRRIKNKENELSALQLTANFDPMNLLETILIPEKKVEEPIKPAPKPKAVVETPQVSIDGIYWDSSAPVVVINGKALKEQEEYNGVVINKINPNSISVTWKGRKYELKK